MMDGTVMIAGNGDPVLADYATHCAGEGRRVIAICGTDLSRRMEGSVEFHLADNFRKWRDRAEHAAERVRGLVLFVNKRLARRDQALFDMAIEVAHQKGVECVCVVGSFEVHLGDPRARRAEALVLRSLQGLPTRLVVLRTGHVSSTNSRLRDFLKAWWFVFPLVSHRLRGCCLEGEELFTVIDQTLSAGGPPSCRTYTLLGPNRPWRDRLREIPSRPVARAYLACAWILFPLAIIAGIVGALLDLFAPNSRYLQTWHLQTLRPRSVREMLALYNKYNFKHLKVVGYNNGVVHFGQRHPGKTVLSTVCCNQRARVKGILAEVDAGVTVRQARDLLDKHGRELPVLPNYSYVALGTSFFVPIHGSASDFTTIAETIQKVILYDPVKDRILAATRQDPVFGQFLYNLSADVLLLRLQIQTKPKTGYSVRHLEVTRPSGQRVLEYFHDPQPSNIEIRKAGSKAEAVQVFQYFAQKDEANGAALDVPRDKLGRLWDRLEENAFSRMLYHRLNRWLAYHVELFLSEPDFVRFWDTHWDLPILKIQLRSIRRDGFPHSPFRQHGCISADLFMLKKGRPKFDAYLKKTLPEARLNPGKHST
jgi:hypothetical protein